MKSTLKFVFVLMFIIPLTSCSQKEQNVDKLFFEVKGPIKTMTVFQDFSHGIGRDVYYFSKTGELQKVEHFNSFKENEEVKIGNVTYFKNQEGKTRYYYQTEFDSDKITETFSINLTSKTQINYSFETTKKDVKIDKVITYNKLGNPVKSISQGRFYADSNNVQREYFYDKNNELSYSVLTNFVKNKVEKIHVKKATKDQYGNVTQEEYVDKDGKTLHTFRSEFTYY